MPRVLRTRRARLGPAADVSWCLEISVLMEVRAMDDILSQGGDREPSRWPRRLAMIAVLIVVVVGGAVYLSLPRHQHAPVATHRTPRGPAPVPTESGELNLRPGPDGITGKNLTWDRDLRLPVAGAQPVWFSPASGRSEPIGGLPTDRSGYQFIRVVGGWAVQASPALLTGCGSCAGPPVPVWLLADGARSVTRVGTANLVAPAATAGAVWLTSYAPGINMVTAAGTAREADATGTLTRSVSLPPGYAINQGTDRGLLLAPVSRQPGAAVYKLWDPSAPHASQAFDGVLAASPSEIAWTSRCAPKCSVQTLDLATGRHTVVALPAGSSATNGAFSPGGGFLALQVSFGNTGDGGDLAMQLEVARVTSGRLTAVPGTWVSSDALVGFGWPAGGDSLVAEFSFTTKMQLASWHPGASRPAVAVIRPGRNQASLILG
ncbi:MAG TPA: hypothetical protein VF482_21975 [Trebonia sp.]